MLIPAYIPSWWYKIMDERVIRHYKGSLDKINMDPDNRESLLKQYAQVAAEIAATTIEALQAESTQPTPAESAT
jgi:alkane 1-monooxygenase